MNNVNESEEIFYNWNMRCHPLLNKKLTNLIINYFRLLQLGYFFYLYFFSSKKKWHFGIAWNYRRENSMKFLCKKITFLCMTKFFLKGCILECFFRDIRIFINDTFHFLRDFLSNSCVGKGVGVKWEIIKNVIVTFIMQILIIFYELKVWGKI